PGTTRKNAFVASLFAPFVSDVRVADGEICAIPAAVSAPLADATPPDVAGPIATSTFGSEMNFCATTSASPGPFSTGVSPCRSCTLSPYFFARVFTAYLDQESCSWPMNPPPPVSGVMSASLTVLLQLIACVAVTADEPAPAVDASAATTIVASASTTPPRRFIPFLLRGEPSRGETPVPASMLRLTHTSAGRILSQRGW